MGSKTIGLREDVYDRLRAQKEEGESFTDLIDRILDESQPDWRDVHGSLDGTDEDIEELLEYVTEPRVGLAEGASKQQDAATDALTGATDETP